VRVLHAPVNIGNQPWMLSRAERRLGLESDLVVNYQTWLGYPADRVLSEYGAGTFKHLAARASFGALAPWRYDVLHFYFGRSSLCWDDLPKYKALAFLDLKMAKRLGKRVFMTLQGCDVRLAGESHVRNEFTPCGPGLCGAYDTCVASLDDQRRALIADVLPLCDRVFALNPELIHFVPDAEFVPYANVDIHEVAPVGPTGHDRPLIVHAPSSGDIKGTPRILAAMDELKKQYEFDFVLVENKTHAEAMELYKQADMAIDQVLSGWYGGFAVEMMAMGKPVACYIRDEDCSFVPEELMQDLPILKLNPNSLVKDLGDWLVRWQELAARGAASRAFVEKWHDPDVIAEKMAKYYAA